MANKERPRRTRRPGRAASTKHSKQPPDRNGEVDDDDYVPAIGPVDQAKGEHGVPRPEGSSGRKRISRRKRVSEHHHAENAARREVGNYFRLELLREYLEALTAVRDLCNKIYEPIEDRRVRRTVRADPAQRGVDRPSARSTALARDTDLLADGLSGDGEPLRVALAREIELVSDYLRLADVGDFTPRSPDDLQETTAAIMMERGVSDYGATAAVYRVESAAIALSAERQRVIRAGKRRDARREASPELAGREYMNDDAVDRAIAEVDGVTLRKREKQHVQAAGAVKGTRETSEPRQPTGKK